jgi:hypothetical protein
VEADWRRSKERGGDQKREAERTGEVQRRDQICKENIRLGDSKTQKLKVKSIPAGLLIPAGTGRNGPKRAKRPGILAEVEQGGDSYRFAYRYEIFRPFRPERNGLYNTDYLYNYK